MKKCKYCNGTGKKTCEKCYGVGTLTDFNVSYFVVFSFPIPETVICKTCNGTGKVDCPYCNGKGEFNY